MKRKETRISLVITVVLIVLFVTRQLWFPSIYQYLSPRQIKFETLHDLLETINGVIALISSLISIYLLFFNRPSEPQKLELLVPLSLEKYNVDLLGKMGSRIEWFDRGVVSIDTLLGNKLLLIIGKRKVGKTREAFELIQKMINNDYISVDRVYDLSTSLRNYTPESARNYVLQIINRNAPNLFYIENLPTQYTGTGLKVLSAVVDALQDSHQDYYLIITARSDQLVDEHRQWIAKYIHDKVELHKISSQQVIDMVTKFTNNYEISLGDGAIEEFVDHSDGTTDQLVHSFLFIHNDKIKILDKQLAHEYALKSSLEMWRLIWGEMKNVDPDSAYVMKSIATFYRAGVEPYSNYIEKYANFLKVSQKALTVNNVSKAFRIVIEKLKDNDITVEDGIIHIRDSMVDGSIEPPDRQMAILELSKFIKNSSKLFSLIKKNDHLAKICTDLAYQSYVDQSYKDSITLFNLAIKVSLPIDWIYYDLGVDYWRLGQTDQAITEFRKAIEINPNEAKAHSYLGNAYAEKGQTDQASIEYRIAIKIDPNDAVVHGNIGFGYDRQGKIDQAITEYRRVIEINPNSTEAHFNLGAAYDEKGQTDDAISEYLRVIEINPNDAGAHFNLGFAYDKKGQTDDAISEYLRVIEINPNEGSYHIAIARISKNTGDLAVYDQEIAKARQLITTGNNYNYACLECVAGNIDNAITILDVVLKENPSKIAWAKRDLDLESLHDDPRFQELVSQ
jgi:tetratricopeptide (TPR) repeat protein